MRKIFRFCFSAFVCFVALAGFAAGASAQVLINEFVADPARDWDGDGAVSYRDDEWVEIANVGRTAVDLSGYRLADAEGPSAWRYGFAGTLAPGETRVVYGSDARAWEEANGFPVYGLSLNNTGDRVALYRIAGADTALVDEYVYAEIAARDDRSIGRRLDQPATWVTFDGHNPCTASCDPPGTGCLPTPGLRNTCLTAVERATWGAIKSIYR